MLKFLRYLLLPTSLFIFALGKVYASWNTILLGILAFWFVNIFYCFEDIRQRIYFFIFNITLFVFLISRPVISFFRGDRWWYFEAKSVNFALNGLMITLVFMLLGYSICEYLIKYKSNLPNNRLRKKNLPTPSGYFEKTENSSFVFNLRIISLILFFISFSFLLICEMEKLTFMRSRKYVELYTSFKSQLPYIFTTIGSASKYFLCVFLATLPKKKLAFIPLMLYIISAIPSLFIGLRNPIVLNIIFVFLYYFTRDTIDSFKDNGEYSKKTIYKRKINAESLNEKAKKVNKANKSDKRKKRLKKWIGKKEWACIILLTPIFMIFLSVYNYIREESQAESLKAIDIIIDFFYKQGVSFDVLCIGYETIPKIEYTGFKNYTFGGIIDYFTHGKLAQILWGAESFGSGNNLDVALYSNNFSHRMSYASRGEEYLQGHGWGSSFILETYADFGYFGIILFSILLGMFFAYTIKLINRGSIMFAGVLIALTDIYFCPRDAALGWISFIVYIQFIVSMVFCYILANLCIKEYRRKNHILDTYDTIIN